jgi:hypothetical protein
MHCVRGEVYCVPPTGFVLFRFVRLLLDLGAQAVFLFAQFGGEFAAEIFG